MLCVCLSAPPGAILFSLLCSHHLLMGFCVSVSHEGGETRRPQALVYMTQDHLEETQSYSVQIPHKRDFLLAQHRAGAPPMLGSLRPGVQWSELRPYCMAGCIAGHVNQHTVKADPGGERGIWYVFPSLQVW